MQHYIFRYPSPLGELTMIASEKGLKGIFFPDHKLPTAMPENLIDDKSPFTEVCHQLDEYFDGKRQTFNIELDVSGTDFQKEVWQVLQVIPYGETIHYQQLAEAIGKPKASRAVGAANGKNPLSIVIPCHRVIGKNGKLTGYAGGVDAKKWLLTHEKNS
ncbi:methylated-DNA--[protein]-cysteine S-methyltransferase [Veronia pacifica]|uniref:Methylated-DNA--protein-cysteine methyltransferase n=1 Tax=Veronia pacifica TaxID=1080227 RepID=A0A1C3EMT9_9GAMM|nr:methylated-DNA--[protein]-cysteine S-methyltransferase [Veronia pacifica]ODA34550.1 cysteine methyltransferase [Veronia pacifica]